MKTILCKPNEKPQVVEIPDKHDYRDLKKVLEIESPITVVCRKIGGKEYDIWLDDEGLFKDKRFICGQCKNAEEALIGNLLITKSNENGETIGLTDEEITEIMVNGLNRVYINNGFFVDFLRRRGINDYKQDEEGNYQVVTDYNGFGEIYLDPKGYLLLYTC